MFTDKNKQMMHNSEVKFVFPRKSDFQGGISQPVHGPGIEMGGYWFTAGIHS